MDVIHYGFDGLEVAFQARISTTLANELELAKMQAAETRHEVPITYNGVTLRVAETGARGGYAYRCDTGPFGATWFFKQPNLNDPWGVRVSVKSLPLAVRGLGKVRADIYEFLDKLEIQTTAEGVSIGRVDYAVDILAPDFVLEPDNFVMHSRTNRKAHNDNNDIVTNGHSGRTTSVTIGKNPGRQVIFYDKREEIINKHKVEWPHIWNEKRFFEGKEPLDFTDATQSRIWRVELRACKRHLKDVWGVTTWQHLDAKLAEILSEMVDAIRYTEPSSDPNRSRRKSHSIWVAVRKVVKTELFEMAGELDEAPITELQRQQKVHDLYTQMLGLGVATAALEKVETTAFQHYLRDLMKKLEELSHQHKEPLEKRLVAAQTRYAAYLGALAPER